MNAAARPRASFDSPSRRYLAACCSAFLAVALRRALSPILGDFSPFLLDYPAVILSAWCAGTGPGILTTLLCALGTTWFILPPENSLAVVDPAHQLTLGLFLVTGVALCLLAGKLRHAEGQAAEGAEAITERARAEKALRESEALFHDFMRHTPALAFIRDSECRIVYVNETYERFFGATLEELKGKPISAVVPEENAQELFTLYQRVLTTGEPMETSVTFPSPEGKPHDWDFYLFRITNAAGEHFMGGLATDVTHQHNLETQLRQSQKMDAVGKLAGGVAHDFNNMLGVIIGYTDLVIDDPTLSDEARQHLEQVLKAGERAGGLTRQLLAFSRQQVIAPGLLDLNDVLTDVGKLLRRLIGEDVELVVLPSAAPAPIMADQGQLEQILLNLAVNARDAMPRGGQLTVEVSILDLDEAYAREHLDVVPGRYAMLAVSDTGCGMDRETQERIFEPFFTTKAVGSGTGLGLAIVHGIVRQSGGDIRVYSEVGHGTTFKIYFPLAADGSVDSAPSDSTEVLTGSETVLLVEDEPLVRGLVLSMLRDSGYEVLEAEDGEHALQVAGQYEGTIDLLLTDVVMPKLGGAETALRLTEQRPGLKTVFMSGYTDDAVVRHGVLHREAHFVQKPFTAAALTRKLREALDSRTETGEPRLTAPEAAAGC